MSIDFTLLITPSHLVVSSSILLNDLSTDGTVKETQLPTKGVDDAAGATAEGEKEIRVTKDSTGELPPIAFLLPLEPFNSCNLDFWSVCMHVFASSREKLQA